MAVQANAAQQAAVANATARQLILTQSIEMKQQIFGQTIASPGSANNVLNIAPRNVGLITGFLIEIAATIANSTGGSVAITPAPFGAANLLSQIVFTDLNNFQRIQTTGQHLGMINTIRRGRPFGSATTTDTPNGYGNNFTNVISMPSSIADAGSGTVYMMYWVPLAYDPRADLRGAVFANVVNATMNLQLTINPTPVGAAAGDRSGLVYMATGGAGSISSITVNVYQYYRDQLPQLSNGGGPLLPLLDLATVYELKNTTFTGMAANQEFPIPYSNFRDFYSTTAIFVNGVGAGLGVGADISYWSLQAANFVNIFKLDPRVAALEARLAIGDDMPLGTYYFDHRARPLSTIQTGNMQLVLNASTVNANAKLLLGYEDMAILNQVLGAGSLAGGGQ